MYSKTVRQFTCRMNYEDEDHVKIMQTLDDLNTDVYKSVNKFIIEALKYYIKAMDEGVLTRTGVEQARDFVTRKELIEELENAKEDVKKSLYEELFKLLTGTLIAAGTPLNTRNNKDGITYPDSTEARLIHEHTQEEKDVSQQLSQYENVMSQVMSWGDD